MTIHLPDDLQGSIRAEVLRGRFATEADAVAAIVREHFRREAVGATATAEAPAASGPDASAASEPEAASDRRPFWERILERTAAVPEEEWDKLPADLAEQHDHYLYGTPKRPTA